jgi:hypothetical protein
LSTGGRDLADVRSERKATVGTQSEERSFVDAARRVVPLVLWCGVLVVGVALFHALGGGRLAAPPLAVGGWAEWLAARDPIVAAVAVLRLVVLAVGWYLLAATTVGLVARLLRSARAVRVADAVTLPTVRRLLEASLGVALTVGVVAAAAPGGALARDARIAIVLAAAGSEDVASGEPSVGVGPVLGGPSLPARTGSGPGARPLPLQLADSEGEAEQAAVATTWPPATEVLPVREGEGLHRDGGETAVDAGELRPVASGGSDATGSGGTDADSPRHVVAPGESLWSIAHDVLARELGRAPTDAEVTPYWRELVASHRPHLPDPDNPDLLYPDDVVGLLPTTQTTS